MSGAASPTATGRVYDGIYHAILERQLAPGTWLREEDLAETFDVSRTLVRQALHRLAQDRVIDLHPNRGAQVPQPDREMATHVFDARRVVECDVARRLGGRLDEGQFAQLQALIDDEAAATARGDRSAAIRLSGEFHRALVRMGGNPVFTRIVDGLLPTTSILIALYEQSGGEGVCVAHRHVELLQALREGGGAAAAEMRRHLREIERSLTPGAPAGRPLRDAFARYRDEPGPAPAAPPGPPA